MSTGDRTILGSISKRGNRYLRALFVQAAWVVLIREKNWERHGLKPWIEAARKRLHHNVLAVALANKLARIAWSVLARGRGFEPTFAVAARTICAGSSLIGDGKERQNSRYVARSHERRDRCRVSRYVPQSVPGTGRSRHAAKRAEDLGYRYQTAKPRVCASRTA